MAQLKQSLDLAVALSKARDKDSLNAALVDVMDHMGATACSLLYFDSIAHGAPAYEVAHWPDRLMAEYGDVAAGKTDPVMQHLRLRTSPIAWARDTFKDAGQLRKWELYADHGVASGVDIALHVSPTRHFVLGFGWAEQSVTPANTHSRVAQVQTLAVFAEPTSFALANQRIAPVITEPLSDRELQCLTFAAKGYADKVTATLLHLSHRSVQTHVAEAIRKLGASNRVQAAVLAAAAGLITLDL